MKKIPFYCLLILMFASCAARNKTYNSSKTDNEKYELAKELLSQNAFSEANKLFTEIYKGSPEKNNLISNSKYLSAFCYYKQLNYKDANFVLYQLINFDPNWESISAAYYLKGVCQFESHNYIDAFIQFSKIDKEPYLKKSNLAKGFFLQTKITNDTINILKNRFPNDKFLNDFNNINFIKTEILTQAGDNFNIACLMPFEASAQNHFIYELYEGMKLAADSLLKVGLKINLIPYETGKDSTKIVEIVNTQNIQNFDFFVGPIYANQQSKMVEFSKKNNVAIINPLSQYNNLSNSLSKYYLNMPSYETQGSEAAKFTIKNFLRFKNTVIIYGIEGGDSLTAKAYKLEYEKNGGKVLLYKRLSKFTANLLPKFMSKVPIDSIGHLAIFTSDPTLSATIFTYLETNLLDKTATYKTEEKPEEKKNVRKINIADIPVIVTSKWLDAQSISYEQFTLHNTHFLFQEYSDDNNFINKNICEKYFTKVGLHATDFTLKGYNLMLYWGSILGKYGKSFPQILTEVEPYNISETVIKNYKNKNDNSFVPILKFEDYNLKIVNF
ncbi:MAG: hypothetical protein EAZ27_09180 [Cytophagales bacterium]|nr:MAG: hypothetical protein EAZ27_09180 [Cytophagales bacterium]